MIVIADSNIFFGALITPNGDLATIRLWTFLYLYRCSKRTSLQKEEVTYRYVRLFFFSLSPKDRFDTPL